ncbi:MAG: acyltransferase [Acidobacteria bacterium]|nr:acyltransferase [Acidobacteriota bacterium]MBI3428070.1 acyltransferase [Acidobacteriota bacterium]
MSQQRIPQLDGLRGIAVLMVVVWHYVVCQVTILPAYSIRLLFFSQSGVDLFFVLSGFLIGGILLDNRDSERYFRAFYTRRIFRIFPLYFLLLALFPIFQAVIASDWLFARPMPLWSYATFTQNIAMSLRETHGANWLGITWSLAVEEQFYFAVPLLVYWLPRRALMAIVVALIAAAPLLRWLWPGFHALVLTPWRGDALMSGVLLALLIRQPGFLEIYQQRQLGLMVVALILGLGTVYLSVEPLLGPLTPLWLAAFYVLALLLALLNQGWFRAVLQSSVLRWFGAISYGLYMVHQAVIGLVYYWVRKEPPAVYRLKDAAISLIAFALSVSLAWLSLQWFELPLQRIGHRAKY